MRFIHASSVLLTLALAAALQAADSPSPAATQNAPKAAAKAPVSPAPNSSPAAATNAAPPAQATNQAPSAPKIPDDHYTNTIGMQFIKVGDFWAGKYLVTQKEYQEIMGSNPSEFQGDLRPVDNVSWEDAMEFCKRLTEHEAKEQPEGFKLPAGFTYTLPTDQQWDSLVGDASLENAVISEPVSRAGTSPVGSLGPNNLGLYDIRGNVWEFCLDSSKPYRILK